MKRKLFSELRTVYETDASDPHTFRLTMKLKDMVDGRILRKAVDDAMERYPYFRVRLRADADAVFFEENTAPVPVLNTKQRITLGSEQTSGHLMAFAYWKNRLYIDAYHGLTDGGGIAPLIKTLLYYYCSAYYEQPLSAEGIRLKDSVISPDEWEDPAARPVPDDRVIRAGKWSAPAFQLEDGGTVRLTQDSVVYNIRIPEKEFMQFNISNDGSPASVVALLLARTVDAFRPDGADPAVIAMCVNQRRALKAPLAHQSLVGDVRLPFTDKIRTLPFGTQATCFRGMVALQSDDDMVLREIREYQELVGRLEKMESPEERRAYCAGRMKALSRCVTAVVSYVGKASLGDAERYVQEYEALPSTALPSVHVPLIVEMSAVNGYFFINFIQYFNEPDHFLLFIRQLRENGLNYDVLNLDEARYPRMELPF